MRSSLVLVLLTLALPLWAADTWPQFRGPDAQGHAQATGLPAEFGEGRNIAWKTAVPGRGYSSPVIAGDAIWMTAAVESPITPEEKARRLAGNTGDQPLVLAGTLSLRAVLIDRNTGKVEADIELMTDSEPDPVHQLNSFASPTPVLEGERLYCHYGTYGTACLDVTTRKVLWTNRTLKIKHENGPGSSPLIFGDLFIVHCDGSDQQYIVGLNKQTGELVWRTERTGKMNANPQLKKAYGTPLIVEIDGRPQLISPAADWLYAYDPTSGKELWKLNYGKLGFSIVPRPVVGHGMIYMCTSFMQSEVLAIRYDGADGNKEPHIAWRFGKQAPQMPSPLLVGDELYIVSDKGVATCLDAQTGQVHWTERLGGNFASSPLLADGKIYVGNRDGSVFVLAPGKTFQLLATNTLEGAVMASPAALGRELYMRTDKYLYRIEARP